MSNYFPSDYEEFIFTSRYARWLPDEQRRETWPEAVARAIGWLTDKTGTHNQLYSQLYDAVLNFHVMPSMRLLMTAGPAAERDNTCIYNCAYLTMDSLRSLDELMYILMCGTGVGFSVERQYVQQLPRVSEHFESSGTVVHIADSKAGWARGFKELIALLVGGQVPRWDTSSVRPAGSRLVTFGGRASGPEPLERLFEHTVRLFRNAAGRKLTTLEVHDLCCMIADIVVVGGVRRSAMISLSDLDDHSMRDAKSGNWWRDAPHRKLANNSAVYYGKPDTGAFLHEWTALYESKSGERGIFNRTAALHQATRNGRRQPCDEFGTNPCSEIILRPFEFCNLSELVVRSDDTLSTLKDKITLATILGTLQSTCTNFKYLRQRWKTNCDEERLLGVSMTGIYDNYDLIFSSDNLIKLKNTAVEVNKAWAEQLGINQSAATTCVKPSGTVSELVDSASGMHPRWSEYYIRTVRADNKDPLTQFMKDQGIPNEPALGKEESTTVFSFPKKSPADSVTTNNVVSTDHFYDYISLQAFYCEHKPSVTINVAEDEWIDMAATVYNNFPQMVGVSFLPAVNHVYKQAPFQTCTEEEYLAAVAKMPQRIDWSKLKDYEKGVDTTTASQELACTGNVCSVVDVE